MGAISFDFSFTVTGFFAGIAGSKKNFSAFLEKRLIILNTSLNSADFQRIFGCSD